jgi:hypothetical protein
MLLGLSMVPTVLGALAGIQMQFQFLAGSPLISFVLFLGIAWGFMGASRRTRTAASASPCCLASPSSWA